MAFLNNTPKGALITENMPYMAKIVQLPEYILRTPCIYDTSDPYWIYKKIANNIIAGISQIENKREYYSNEKFSYYANRALGKPALLGLLELLTNRTSMYKPDMEELRMNISLNYRIGEIFFETVASNELTDNLRNLEFYIIVSKSLKEKGCFYDLISGIRMYDLIENLQKHQLYPMNLEPCQLTVLSCIDAKSQCFYFNIFEKYKDNPLLAWNQLRTHVYERELIEKYSSRNVTINPSSKPIEKLISKDFLFSIRQECFLLFGEETIKETLNYIKNSYIKENFPGFITFKITRGIKELLGCPVIDYIGTDSNGNTKILSFRVINGELFQLGLQSVIELKKKGIIMLYSEKGKKKKYVMEL